MQSFLVTQQKNKCSIINKSNSIQYIEDENVMMLFSFGNLELKIENFYLLYQTMGIEFLKNIALLEESFSLFLYDKKEEKIFIAKDKIGLHPLYYSQEDETIIVSSSLRAISKLPNFKATINTDSIAHYLQYGLILEPNTIFENCHKVLAGTVMTFDLKNNTQHTQKYWQLEQCYFEKKSLFNEKEILHTAHDLLDKSLKRSMKSNDKFGFSLSGGYDSSTLVAMAQKHSDTAVNTFSIGFENKYINEAPEAKKIAKYLGTNHTEHYFTAKDALEIIPTICQIYDEPFADYATAPTLLTSQLLAKDNVTKLIAGDGGDEVFATADDLRSFKLFEQTPSMLKQILSSSLTHLPSPKKFKNKQHKLAQMLRAKSVSGIIKVRKALFLEQELSLYIKALKPNIPTSFDEVDFTNDAEVLDQIIGTYFKTTMTDGELVKSYTAMKHRDIGLATPFLDVKLIEYLAKVPASIKVKNDIKKYLLKEITHQYLPKNLMDRPKSGFDIPFSTWMRNELKEMLYTQVNKERLNKDNLFYTSSILQIRDRFYAGEDNYKYKLWRIFIFQLWYENFTLNK